MTGAETAPEPDTPARPPRETPVLIGQETAETRFLDAVAENRLHHAWLITGPKGVGKATLAWRIARFLLARDEMPGGPGLFGDPAPAPASLDVPPDHPVARRLLALSEPRLFLLRRAWDDKARRLKTVITVDEVRKLKSFFALSAADGGHRVVIVDAADDMNVNAANALLKLLEEPPDRVTLLLISHQPARLLPTIRSRCRTLRCHPLDPPAMARALAGLGIGNADDDAALTELSAGSVGAAVALSQNDGMAVYARIIGLIATCPDLDRAGAIALANEAGARGGEERFELILRLIDLALARLARTGAGLPPERDAAGGERAVLARLAPDPRAGRAWAEAQQSLGARVRRGRAVNLDPAALILDMMLKINETAARIAAAR